MSQNIVLCQLFGIVPQGIRPTVSPSNPTQPPTPSEISLAEDSYLHHLLHTLSLLQRSDSDEGYSILQTPVPYHGLFKTPPIPKDADPEDLDPELQRTVAHFISAGIFAPNVAVSNVRVSRFLEYERVYRAVAWNTPTASASYNAVYKQKKPALQMAEQVRVSRSLPLPSYPEKNFPTSATTNSLLVLNSNIKTYLESYVPFAFPSELASETWFPAIWDPVMTYAALARRAHDWYRTYVEYYAKEANVTMAALKYHMSGSETPFPADFPITFYPGQAVKQPQISIPNDFQEKTSHVKDNQTNEQLIVVDQKMQKVAESLGVGSQYGPLGVFEISTKAHLKNLDECHISNALAQNPQSACFLDETPVNGYIPSGTPWVFQSYSRPKQTMEGSTTSSRLVSQSVVGENYENFLRFLGLTLNFEVVLQGFNFQIDESTEIRVYQVYKVPKCRDVTSAIRATVPGKRPRWICEIRSITTPQSESQTEDRMKQITQLLSPINFIDADLYNVLAPRIVP